MRTKKFGTLTFKIDRPKGTVKEWPKPDGSVRRYTYGTDYGYLPRFTGEDGEGLDFFVGDAEDGHLESFQKLKKNDDGKYVLDETKFLVGVTDAEREDIYKLYGPEVWHRKRYRDMDELERDLPKFAAKKKDRYVETEKDAFDLGAIRRRISTIPNAMRDAFMGSKPTMLAPMVRRTAPTLPRPVPGSYNHTPGAVHGGMLESHAAPTMLAPMVRQSAPQAIEQWANHRGSGSMIDSMAQRAGQMGYPEAAKARTLGEFRDAFTSRGYTPQEVFAPTDPAMMGRLGVNGRRTVQPEWQTTSKVGEVLARFGLSEKLADSFADHGRAAVYGFGSGVLNGVVRPYRALRYGMPVEMRYLLDRSFSPSTRTDAAAALAGIPTGVAALGYGAYRGGKVIYNKLSPQDDAEMTPKQAELEAPGEEGGAHLPRALGHLGVGTAFGYGAYHAGMGGAERLLGAQRFLHGTSDHAAEGILREGLQPRFGGSGSAAINPDYVNSSRGFSHVAVGPRSGMMARFYANLGEHEARSPGSLDGVQEKLMGVFSRPDPLKALTDDPKLKGTIKEMVGGSLGAPGYRKGTVLHGAMPYESFLKKFIPDTDQPSGFKTREEVTGLSRSSTGLRDMWRNRASDMLQYVRNNPRRVGVGAGLTAMGLGLGYGGYKQLRKAYGDVRGETPEQGIKQAVLARYGLDKVADIDKKITGEILMTDIGKKTAGVKVALTPLVLGAMGAGIGAGVGAVHGFRTDDPTQSVEHHVLRGARNALIGAGIGTGVGVGGAAVLGKAAPELVERSRQGPFPNIDPKHPHAPYHQLAQNLYDAWLNPVTRLGMGAYAGKNLAQSYGNMVDDWRLQQYAAQKGKTDAPETPNAAHLEAIRARRHMGAYLSSLDRSGG